MAESASFILEVSKASGKEQRGLCLPPPTPLTGHPTLPGPEDFAVLTFMPDCSPPGPELPQASARLAQGRGPAWEDGRRWHTWGEGPGSARF